MGISGRDLVGTTREDRIAVLGHATMEEEEEGGDEGGTRRLGDRGGGGDWILRCRGM